MHFVVLPLQESQSPSAQIITTTFKREFVEVSDKVIGVTIKENVSTVHDITKDEAIEFIHKSM